MKWQFDKYLILESEQRQKHYALKVVLIVGVVIAILKLSAFFLTRSNAILSDSLESLINLAAGGFTLFSVYYAGKPRDSRHPYGHGKIEFLATMVEGSLIFGAGSIIIIKAFYNFFYPNPVQNIDIGITAIGVTAVANFLLSLYLKNKAAKLDSMVLRADSKRLATDAYSSVGLVVGLTIIYFTDLYFIDSILAVLSGVLIIRTGYTLVKQSVKGLLDAADTDVLSDVVELLQLNSRVEWIDIQNMRTSHHGMYLYIDCHLTLPWYWNLNKVSEQVLEAELLINKHFKERVELFVQAEPCKPKNCSQCRIADCPVRQHAYRKKSPLRLEQILRPEEQQQEI
ncbi:MAG: cation diffusion facilitator family transporter [Bacteroidia bacterium]